MSVGLLRSSHRIFFSFSYWHTVSQKITIHTYMDSVLVSYAFFPNASQYMDATAFLKNYDKTGFAITVRLLVKKTSEKAA